MRNYPKYINTMQDLVNAKEFDPERTKKLLQSLIESKDAWLMQRALLDGETIVETETTKIVSTDNGRYVYEFKEDPNGALFQLGFITSQEAIDFLASM